MSDSKDCSGLELVSWMGSLPAMSTIDFPLDRATFGYPSNFAKEFNADSEKAINRAVSEKKIPSNDATYVCPYLMYCEGIHPRALSLYFFQKKADARSLFFYYFSSANLDYISLPDAMRLLLSRVAYPDGRDDLYTIFIAFADAYYEANQYIRETRDEIAKLAVASVVLSLSRRKNNTHDGLSGTEFTRLVSMVSSSDEYKLFLYDSLRAKPIPLFFISMQFPNTDPEMKKKGQIFKAGGMFKRKKKLYAVLSEDGILRIYRDQNGTDMSEEIQLQEAVVKFVPAKDKEPAKMAIISKEGKPFGASVAKSVRKTSKKTQYDFSCANELEIKSWIDNMNFVAFFLTLRVVSQAKF
jgi:hypothetical protein